MTALSLTRPIYLRAAIVVAIGLGLLGYATLHDQASRGELIVLRWGGER